MFNQLVNEFSQQLTANPAPTTGVLLLAIVAFGWVVVNLDELLGM